MMTKGQAKYLARLMRDAGFDARVSGCAIDIYERGEKVSAINDSGTYAEVRWALGGKASKR